MKFLEETDYVKERVNTDSPRSELQDCYNSHVDICYPLRSLVDSYTGAMKPLYGIINHLSVLDIMSSTELSVSQKEAIRAVFGSYVDELGMRVQMSDSGDFSYDITSYTIDTVKSFVSLADARVEAIIEDTVDAVQKLYDQKRLSFNLTDVEMANFKDFGTCVYNELERFSDAEGIKRVEMSNFSYGETEYALLSGGVNQTLQGLLSQPNVSIKMHLNGCESGYKTLDVTDTKFQYHVHESKYVNTPEGMYNPMETIRKLSYKEETLKDNLDKAAGILEVISTSKRDEAYKGWKMELGLLHKKIFGLDVVTGILRSNAIYLDTLLCLSYARPPEGEEDVKVEKVSEDTQSLEGVSYAN